MRKRFNACGSPALLQLRGKTFKDDTDRITAGDRQSLAFRKSLRLQGLASTLRSYAGSAWRFGLGEAQARRVPAVGNLTGAWAHRGEASGEDP